MRICLVILAAGISSRFNNSPKQMAKVGPNGETLIEYSVNQALMSPISQIHFIIGDKTEHLIKNIFKNRYKGIPVTYTKQRYSKYYRKKPWGTADALSTIKGYVTSPFMVINGDDIYGSNTFRQCYNHLVNIKDNVFMGYRLGNTLPSKGKVNRGIVLVDKNNNMTNIKEILGIEKKNISEHELNNSIASVNFFGFQPYVIDIILRKNNLFKWKNKYHQTKECYLPTIINELINENKIKVKVLMSNDRWLGITNPGDEVIVAKSILENADKYNIVYNLI